MSSREEAVQKELSKTPEIVLEPYSSEEELDLTNVLNQTSSKSYPKSEKRVIAKDKVELNSKHSIEGKEDLGIPSEGKVFYMEHEDPVSGDSSEASENTEPQPIIG